MHNKRGHLALGMVASKTVHTWGKATIRVKGSFGDAWDMWRLMSFSGMLSGVSERGIRLRALQQAGNACIASSQVQGLQCLLCHEQLGRHVNTVLEASVGSMKLVASTLH
jgi:hypothetical protein